MQYFMQTQQCMHAPNPSVNMYGGFTTRYLANYCLEVWTFGVVWMWLIISNIQEFPTLIRPEMQIDTICVGLQEEITMTGRKHLCKNK